MQNNELIELVPFSYKLKDLKSEAKKALVGQDQVLDLILTAYFAGGHVLIEGAPGLAKTLVARLLGALTATEFKRIQFTPDLMPADIIGTMIFHPGEATFSYKKGPIFSNLVLIDEVNRAPAKTQAALFEVMQEHQVTQDGVAYMLPSPFMIMATQNPIEQEGTYRLPEAQLDRFMFKINVGYPTLEEEGQILRLHHGDNAFANLTFLKAIVTGEQLLEFRSLLTQVMVKDELIDYIAKLIQNTRQNAALSLGASPRASIDLLSASKALAGISGRDFVTPEDIQYLLPSVIQHQIGRAS
ncbi:MAG: MoxR family ATPase, partial [Cyclobacteriaceae bacterium]